MIGILGQVMEIHNSESIHHISRVQRITSILLERLCQKTDIYGLSGMDRYLITTASSLHDIGKVAIDDRILNAHDLTPASTPTPFWVRRCWKICPSIRTSRW